MKSVKVVGYMGPTERPECHTCSHRLLGDPKQASSITLPSGSITACGTHRACETHRLIEHVRVSRACGLGLWLLRGLGSEVWGLGSFGLGII